MADRATNLTEAKKKLDNIHTYKGLAEFNQFMKGLGPDLAPLQKELRNEVIELETNPQFKAVLEKAIDVPNTQNPDNVNKPIHDYMKTATPQQAMRNVFGGKSTTEKALIALRDNPNDPKTKELLKDAQTEINKMYDKDSEFKLQMDSAREKLGLNELDMNMDAANLEAAKIKILEQAQLGSGRLEVGATNLGAGWGRAVVQQFGPDIPDLNATAGQDAIQDFSVKMLDTISQENADHFKLKAKINLDIDKGEELDLKVQNREDAEDKAEGPAAPTPKPFDPTP